METKMDSKHTETFIQLFFTENTSFNLCLMAYQLL